jgi:response regulator RpfG family c-di-GMP phosphodiesterase
MSPPVPARRGRILVVDDQRANVEMLSELLRSRGYDVFAAYSGEEALERIAAQAPDIVISDSRTRCGARPTSSSGGTSSSRSAYASRWRRSSA